MVKHSQNVNDDTSENKQNNNVIIKKKSLVCPKQS